MGVKGKKFDTGYATIKGGEEEGTNYREIAELMTMIGIPMNHSSARNYVIRALQKFAYKISEVHGFIITEDESLRIARDPRFQSYVCEMMHYLEFERRAGVILTLDIPVRVL